METKVSFGQWLEKRRKALDLTREELARRIGSSTSALRKIESDERRPSKQLAELLANALDIPANERSIFIRIARGEFSPERLKDSLPLPTLSLLQTPQRFSNPIPIPPTPLIGRETELAALRQMLDDVQCRLITLVGPGGSGKTRLALEIASEQGAGAALVLLANANSPSMIVPAIAEAVGFTFYGNSDPKVQLLNYLRDKHMLLVLDDMEHLLDGADLVAEILRSAPPLKILCTSREPFNLHGEWVFEVGGLKFPRGEDAQRASNYSANTLFVQCAQRAKAGFTPTAEDLPMVTRICTLVEGMPLAIELAAAWVRTLSCREIAQEIEHDLDILSTPARDMPERHRSIQAVFDHSWNLLSPEERCALARLSVFRGGFTRPAAEQVTGASLATLSSLVSKSLVRRTDAGRYDLHEILHPYAAARLELEPEAYRATRARHYTFYLDLAETADCQLRGSDQLEWLSRLEQELDNLRAALEWSLADNAEQPSVHRHFALRLASALRWFWQIRGHFHEGSLWLRKALEIDESKPGAPSFQPLASLEDLSQPEHLRSQARALEGLALLTNSLGNHSTAYTLAEQSLAICQKLGDRRGTADALMVMGQTLHWQGQTSLGDSYLAEALALYREAGDEWNVARSLYRLGAHLADSGGDVAGRAMLEESSAILEKLGDKFLFISVLVSRGVIALTAGDYADARLHFDRSLVIAREIGDPWEMADALTNIGCVLRIQGNFAGASSLFEEALTIYQKGGRGIWCTDPLCALAENEIAQGNLSAARLYLEQALTNAESSENKWLETLVGYFHGLLAYYEGNLERATKLLEENVNLARESQYKPDLARSLVSLGRVMSALGQSDRAKTLLTECLGLFYELGSRLGIATALEGFAVVSLTKDMEQAARLFGSAEALRAAIGAPMAPVDCPAYQRDLALIKTRLGESLFAKAWAEGYSQPYLKTASEILGTSDVDPQNSI